MFEQLRNRLTDWVKTIRGTKQLTEVNIQSALRNVRAALIEADVALTVVTEFITAVQQKVIGQAVVGKTRPGELLIKLVQDELIAILGSESVPLDLNHKKPMVIVVAGLQGSGKTTTAVKLAHWLSTVKKQKVMVSSLDIYRPAAILQLQTLAQANDILFFASPSAKPVEMATDALKEARHVLVDVLILDTAGRLHVDAELMQELQGICEAVQPVERLLVVDSMMGQDAAKVAKSFQEAVSITGVILSKLDADARGGAALSVRMISGQGIKFLGTGEKISAFEVFYPERIASRILGMGDIVSWVEEVQRQVDKEKTEDIAKKFVKGKRLDFNDLRIQLQEMKKLGGMQSLLDKLPQGMSLPKTLSGKMNDTWLTKMEAIIGSMTTKERQFPALLNTISRKKRVAMGSGTSTGDVNQALKHLMQTQKKAAQLAGTKMQKRLQHWQGKELGDL